MWLDLLWKFFVFIKIITFFQFRNVYLLYQKNDGNFMSLIPLACLRLQFDFRVIFKKSLDCAVQYEVIISFATTICFQFVSLKEIFQNAKSDELFFLFQWYNRGFFYINILNAIINFCETDCIIKINIRQLYCQHDIQYYDLEIHTVSFKTYVFKFLKN